jgi:hypothetical protein
VLQTTTAIADDSVEDGWVATNGSAGDSLAACSWWTATANRTWDCMRERERGGGGMERVENGEWSPPSCFLRGSHAVAPGWIPIGRDRHMVAGQIFRHGPMPVPIWGTQ